MSLSGRGKRSKGARGERELAAILSKELGVDIKRLLGAARDGGNDIEFHGFSVEVKRQEKLNIHNAIAQAIENRKEGLAPIVAFRRSHDEWNVALRLRDFLRLVKMYSRE